MKINSMIFCLFLAIAAHAQEGIQFSGISWKEATAKASADNKLIFVDCFTTWCGPCKWMDKFVFPLDSVAGFCNSNFINVKRDMEKGEGIELKKKYAVHSYPTYLFINGQGDVIHRTGSRMEAGEFMQQARAAIDPNNSFVGMQKRYNSGERSTDLLYRYTMALKKTQPRLSDSVASQLISTVSDKELQSFQGWEIIRNLTKNENDRLATFLKQHHSYFVEILGEEPVTKLNDKLRMLTMFSLTREKDDKEFFSKLRFFKENKDSSYRINGALLEGDYYLNAGNAEAFIKSSNESMRTTLRYSGTELSFLANKARMKSGGNKQILNQAFLLAKMATELYPAQYSYQSTLAQVCIDLGDKAGALKAANSATRLAASLNSKIQEYAKELLKKAEQL